MQRGLAFFGPDRLLFAGNHLRVAPLSISGFMGLVAGCDIRKEDNAKIFGLNVRKPFKIG